MRSDLEQIREHYQRCHDVDYQHPLYSAVLMRDLETTLADAGFIPNPAIVGNLMEVWRMRIEAAAKDALETSLQAAESGLLAASRYGNVAASSVLRPVP